MPQGGSIKPGSQPDSKFIESAPLNNQSKTSLNQRGSLASTDRFYQGGKPQTPGSALNENF